MFSVTPGRRTVQEGPSMVSCRENITYIYLYKERERERDLLTIPSELMRSQTCLVTDRFVRTGKQETATHQPCSKSIAFTCFSLTHLKVNLLNSSVT